MNSNTSTAAIYFDYNATAPALPEVADAVARALLTGGNPSSVHGVGRKARASLEDARADVAALVGARPADIVFTGGGTEANTLGLKGLVGAGAIERLMVCATEHPSVLELARLADIAVDIIPVGTDGLVDMAVYTSLLEDDRKTLVSIHLANNETGIILPVGKLAEAAKASGALFHTDAVQAVGKIDVDFASLGVDLLSLSAHKFGGPQGVGALVVRAGLELAPLTHGGGQERGRRSGTENVAGIVGMGVAARAAQASLKNATYDLRDSLEQRLLVAAPEAVVIGAGVERLPNTTLIVLPGVAAETQVIQMDLAGFAVSSGSACSSGKVARSHVLDAMGVGDALAGSALRISLGRENTAEEIEDFIGAWTSMRNRVLPVSREIPAQGGARVAS